MNKLSTNESNKLPNYDIDNLLKVYGKEIFSYCYHLLKNKEDAEDAIQEIFFKVYNNLKKRKVDSISLWLYKVAYNHCLNVLRKRKFKLQITLDDNMYSHSMTTEEEMENTEFSYQTQIALDKLSDIQKNIIILRIVERLCYEDISKIINKKPEAIRKSYERAKQKILKYLNSTEGVVYNEETQII